MDEIYEFIASAASILAIPLAIYFYLRSRESKFDKAKNTIVRTLSYQIGEERQLSEFEVQAVINSTLRENKLPSSSISPDQIIEDLVTETISSPLLQNKRKENILKELVEIYLVSGVPNEITRPMGDSEEGESRSTATEVVTNETNIISKEKTHDSHMGDRSAPISTYFIVTITGIFIIFIIVSGFFDIKTDDILGDFKLSTSVIAASISALGAIIAALLSLIIRQRKDHE